MLDASPHADVSVPPCLPSQQQNLPRLQLGKAYLRSHLFPRRSRHQYVLLSSWRLLSSFPLLGLFADLCPFHFVLQWLFLENGRKRELSKTLSSSSPFFRLDRSHYVFLPRLLFSFSRFSLRYLYCCSTFASNIDYIYES